MQILTFSPSLQDMRIERSFLGIVFNLALKMYVYMFCSMFNELFIINPYTKTKQNNMNDEFVKINRA